MGREGTAARTEVPGRRAGPRQRAADVAVIGAGSSGLAVLRALLRRGFSVVGFERGSDVGGQWRYNNDNGLSSAYQSLRTNVSRKRMEYPSWPMPDRYGDFPHHSQMAEYLSSYADNYGLRDYIRFRTTVTALDSDSGNGWRLAAEDGSTGRFLTVVVAAGHFWSPRIPTFPGTFNGATSHSHHYRTAQPFAGRRVLVVGAGQSAAEIACEVSKVAARTCLSVRRFPHIIPRWIGGRPYDGPDVEPLNRMPWPLLNVLFGRAVARELGRLPVGWRAGAGRILEGVPTISSDLLPAVRRAEILVRPPIEFLAADSVRFTDGSEEPFDCIIYATGYDISLPFLPHQLAGAGGRELPLYRHIVAPDCSGLLFAGFVDAPGGLLPVVETQGEWIAALLNGSIRLPGRDRMWRAIDRSERRTRNRFPADSPRDLRCDPHGYRRLLRSDLRKARLFHPVSFLPSHRGSG